MPSNSIKLSGSKINEKGEIAHAWKGDGVKYSGIHWWLVSRFGNPLNCEKCKIPGKKTGRRWSIEWAKIEYKRYERKRENFWGLCKKCHMHYDGVAKPNSGSFKKGLIPWNKVPKLEFTCKVCKNLFFRNRFQLKTAKYCSNKCKYLRNKDE